MADTKISALSAAASAAAANELAINEAGTSKKVTAAQLKTFVNTAPVFAAGSASAATWPLFTAGTLLTTAEDGAMEHDTNCFYLTTDASNRGVVPVCHFVRADATRTLPNDTNVNALFNSPANGRLTLETGCYMFESLIVVTTMSATSGNALINILGAGTATVAAWLWESVAKDATAGGAVLTTAETGSVAYHATGASQAAVAVATTGTALGVGMRGTFEVTGAGTMIPSIDLANASAAVVSIGSYFRVHRVGSTSVVSVGQWD